MQEKNSLRTVSIVRKLRILRRNLCKGKIPAWAEGDRYFLVTTTDAVLRELRDYPRLESSKKTFLAFAVSDTIPDDADIREITDALIRAGGDEAFLRSFPMMRNVSALLRLHEQFGKQVCPPDYPMTIGLLHSTRKIDWEAVWRETSAVEKALLADPAGTYPRCTAESRQEYRNAVRKYARKRRFSEEEVAKKILQMAMETEGGELSDILFPKKQESRRTAVPFLLTGMAAASACVTGYFLRSFGAVRAILTGILLFLPFYAFFREVANIAACRFGHRVTILRLETEHIPKAGKTLVVTAALLSGEKHDTELFSELERQYLRNREKEVRFGILADLGDADHVTEAADENVIGNAVGRIRALNQKYARDGAPFYLFLRPRTYAAGETRFFQSE